MDIVWISEAMWTFLPGWTSLDLCGPSIYRRTRSPNVIVDGAATSRLPRVTQSDADAPIWATLRRIDDGVLRLWYAWPPRALRGETSAFGHLRSQGGDVGDLPCLDHLAVAEVSDHRLI